jgi:hypothetical protein
MPHDRIAIEIAQNARLRRVDEAAFAIVFVGIGISYDTDEMFRRSMEDSDALAHTATFLNLASKSSGLLLFGFGCSRREVRRRNFRSSRERNRSWRRHRQARRGASGYGG